MIKFKSILLSFILLFALFIGSNAQQQVTLYYETNSYTLASKELIKLNLFISKLDSSAKISINGYCDDVGKEEANKILSLERAKEVYKTLLKMGVPASRVIEIHGDGEITSTNTSDKDTLKQRELKRRVELKAHYTPRIEKILSDKLKVGDKLPLKNILFIGGTHTLLPGSYSTLKELTNELTEKQEYSIRLEGHVEGPKSEIDGFDVETKKYNLSETRAKVIYDSLVANDIDPKRLKYTGLKSNFPAKDGRSNMRVEIVITGIKNNSYQINKVSSK